ncbi:hypothetical protein J2794_003560 [Paraburkholderia terricola]|nr:hypothetical protein [Paraburkholderia terricola]MDR6447444.1 hypothetical protein [Paraburkholderia terricola]
MADLKFFVRLVAAFVAIVVILGIAQKLGDAETEHISVSMRNT